jgi:hypothetical protein
MELVVTSREVGEVGGKLAWYVDRVGAAVSLDGRVGGQDLAVQLGQVRARVDAQVGGELGAGLRVGVERLAAPAGTGQRQHELLPQPFAVGVLGDEGAQLAGDGFVPA